MVATVTRAEVMQKALEHGWNAVLVQRALAAGITPDRINNALEMDISLKQAETLILTTGTGAGRARLYAGAGRSTSNG